MSGELKRSIDEFYDLYSPYTADDERDYSKYNMECIIKDLIANPRDNQDCLIIANKIIKLFE
jgi:hypothetical protein